VGLEEEQLQEQAVPSALVAASLAFCAQFSTQVVLVLVAPRVVAGLVVVQWLAEVRVHRAIAVAAS